MLRTRCFVVPMLPPPAPRATIAEISSSELGHMVARTGRHWRSISLFESHDYVGSWYRKAHGGNASAAKIGQINACFAHGREYFRNAERGTRGTERQAPAAVLRRTAMQPRRDTRQQSRQEGGVSQATPRHRNSRLAKHNQRRDWERLGLARAGDGRDVRRAGRRLPGPQNPASLRRCNERACFWRTPPGKGRIRE